uniref:M n=1 Tax=Pelargonium radula virus 1 TaxID=2793734 RepID=A0A8D9PH18_9RHAB|nr:TPA_asm: M [Pelargonium radula virus 1]
MSTWMQIKFEDVKWFNEKISKSTSLSPDPIAKTNAMATGFLSSKFTGEKKPIGDLLCCLIRGAHLNLVNTVGRSKYLGPGSRRCSFLLPKSIVIPTDLKIPLGTSDIPPMSQEIRIEGERYYMTLGMRIKAAVMSDEDADILYASRPKEFIGYLDCPSVPEGALAKLEDTPSTSKSE